MTRATQRRTPQAPPACTPTLLTGPPLGMLEKYGGGEADQRHLPLTLLGTWDLEGQGETQRQGSALYGDEAATPWTLRQRLGGPEWRQRPVDKENPLTANSGALLTELTCAHLPPLHVHRAMAWWGVTKCPDIWTVGVMVRPVAQAAGPCCGMGQDMESGGGLLVALCRGRSWMDG